jgi:phosphatidylglycerol:prolipoprotein diacylglycerol transferase
MYPILWRIPGIGMNVPGFGLMMMAAFLLAILWAARRAARSQANPDVILNCGFIALIGGVVGARVMYVAHYWEHFMAMPSPIVAIIDVRQGGLEVYGGFIAAVGAILVYLWRWGHSIRWYMDIIAPSAALGMAIGRIGCFLNGCCWGGVSHDLPWAVTFPFASPPMTQQVKDRQYDRELPPSLLYFGSRAGEVRAEPLYRDALYESDEKLDAARKRADEVIAGLGELAKRRAAATDPNEIAKLNSEITNAALRKLSGLTPPVALAGLAMSLNNVNAAELRALAHDHRSLPVHPTQIYSAIGLGLLAWALSALYWRRARDGQVIFALLTIEPIMRYLLEIIRADNPTDTAGFTISQFIALCLLLIGVVGLFTMYRLPARSPRARIWAPPPES